MQWSLMLIYSLIIIIKIKFIKHDSIHDLIQDLNYKLDRLN